jgi:arsenate reductase
MTHDQTDCDRKQERTCPIFPGAIWRQQWSLENPAATAEPEEHRQSVRRVRDQLRQHITQFVSEHQ